MYRHTGELPQSQTFTAHGPDKKLTPYVWANLESAPDGRLPALSRSKLQFSFECATCTASYMCNSEWVYPYILAGAARLPSPTTRVVSTRPLEDWSI